MLLQTRQRKSITEHFRETRIGSSCHRRALFAPFDLASVGASKLQGWLLSSGCMLSLSQTVCAYQVLCSLWRDTYALSLGFVVVGCWSWLKYSIVRLPLCFWRAIDCWRGTGLFSLIPLTRLLSSWPLDLEQDVCCCRQARSSMRAKCCWLLHWTSRFVWHEDSYLSILCTEYRASSCISQTLFTASTARSKYIPPWPTLHPSLLHCRTHARQIVYYRAAKSQDEFAPALPQNCLTRL